MYAHYISTTKRKLVIISREPAGREHVKTQVVSGKRAASRLGTSISLAVGLPTKSSLPDSSSHRPVSPLRKWEHN